MKQAFRTILSLNAVDRRGVFVTATDVWRTNAQFIEKDFYVCATLDILFNDIANAQQEMVFKGGTSLSKAHHLIRRFSEDIDLVIVRDQLGFGGDNDPMQQVNPATGKDFTNKERSARIAALKAAAAGYIDGTILPALEAQLAPLGAQIEFDPADEDKQTLLVKYASAFDESFEYNPPEIKLEAGARGAVLPSSPAEILPYAADVLSDYDLRVSGVRTIDAKRTFLDKVIILHGQHCHFRDKGAAWKDANRQSRHYYDLAMMADELAALALSDQTLLAEVIFHSKHAFPRGWMKFDEAETGDILIRPPGDMIPILERDYAQMAGMILDDAPAFDWVLGQIEKIAALYDAAPLRPGAR